MVDGGELVRELYGHPDAKLTRERVREAFRQAPAAPVPLVAAVALVTHWHVGVPWNAHMPNGFHATNAQPLRYGFATAR